MASWIQRLTGNAYLGYRAVLAHPLRKLFSLDRRTGKARFLANYATEGLLPMTDAGRQVLQGAARCIHCGLCEAYDPALSALPRTAYDGASLLAVAYARATPDLPHARTVLAQLTDAQLEGGEAVCPTRVPLRAIAAHLRSELERLDALSAPPRGLGP